MKLSLSGIKDRNIWEEHGYNLPQFDPKELAEATEKSPEWVHFGAGNIFRAYLAAAAQKAINEGALKTGIIAVEGFDPEIIEKIYRPHDNLSIYLTMSDDTVKTIIGSVSDSLILSADTEKLRRIFRAPSLKFVTFTITEKGYNLSGKDGFFADVVSDFESGPEQASSYLGTVTSLLYERFLEGFPLAMISADNCSNNGQKLSEAINTFAGKWEGKGLVKHGFLAFINEKISFPQTMIDKITPRPNPDTERLLTLDGVEDMSAVITSKNTYIAPFVNAEESEYFVVEEDFPNGKIPLENYGVIFTSKETVNATEKMKVQALLNPLHTALAIFGCLLSFTKISDEMKDPELLALVKKLGYGECLPTVADPGIINPNDFLDTVINIRLPNPFLPDSPQRIASDTSQKLSVRFSETVKFYLDSGNEKSLKIIPLVYAGWLRYLLAKDDELESFALSSDPLSDYLKDFSCGITVGENYTEEFLKNHYRKLLSDEKIFGIDLTETSLFDKILAFLSMMLRGKNAVRETIKYVLSEEHI